ncbi:MAG: nucleoside kinase [Clostridia bacterium]|nr:nucleoside kinase [Clostridia bacterium]
MSNINNTIEYICEQSKSPVEFVRGCEERYASKITKIAEAVAEKQGNEIIMIAGPSSAGKTTSAKRMRMALAQRGISSHTVSLDDFYLDNCDSPKFPDGTPDFETVYALDIAFFKETMNKLINDGEADLPEFDFLTGKRKAELNHVRLGKTDVIIVEGLHALNPIITDCLPADRLLKMYINVSSRIYDKDNNIILNKRNMRFIRRMVRDYKFRGNSVEKTYEMWLNVQYGEDMYLFPYKDNADVKINTIHLYETCVLKETAIRLLSEIEKDSRFYLQSQRLMKSLKKFPEIDSSLVPEDSLLREFIGPKEK